MDNGVTDIIFYRKKQGRITKVTKDLSKNGLRTQLRFQGNTIFPQQTVLQTSASNTAQPSIKGKLTV